MEQIDKELSEKTIEKQVDFVVENVIDPPKEAKPKKPRTEAQKEAFEKARKKRVENLKKKKEKESAELVGKEDADSEEDESNLMANKTGKKVIEKKPRGRPRGAKNKKVMKREPEPTPDKPNYPQPVDYAIHPAQDHGFRYQGHQYQSPYPPMAYQPPPQIHNYYYGHQQGAVHQAPVGREEQPIATQPDSVFNPHPSSESDSSSEEEYHPPPTPELKYRFA